jgi:homoserine kinase type II
LSVYTPVSEAQLAAWLRRYAVGAPVALEPIRSGIENTNYFVTTTQGRYVLTLFERLPAAELPFYLDLMAHLARHGVPCPAPIASLENAYLGELNGKPAALVTRLPGASVERPGEPECAELGMLLARLHLAGRSYAAYLENPRGPRWWRRAARELEPFLGAHERALLEAELAFQAGQRFPDLPRGPVHADLFRDNVMFQDGRLTGFFDFYFAGVDSWLFDVAVCLNDWAVDLPTGAHDPQRARAFVDAYASVRPLSAAERQLLPAMLRAGALRFWVSRLWDYHLPREASLLQPHDPAHFERVLRQRVAHPVSAASL